MEQNLRARNVLHRDFFMITNRSGRDVMPVEISCHHNCHRDGDGRGGGRRRELCAAGPEQRGQDEGLDVVGVALGPDADAEALTVQANEFRHAVVEREVAVLGAAFVVLGVVECSYHGC